jgi:cyclic-di-AMP phosphodiesterase PgpH
MFGNGKRPSRLSSWDGRKYSSRGAPLALPRLGRRAVLARAAAVLATVAAVTALVVGHGPPLPYRTGEVPPTDLRVRVAFEVVNLPQTERLREESVERGEPPDDVVATVPPVVERYPAGAAIVRRGQPITEGQLALLRSEQRAFRHSWTAADHLRRGAGLFAVIGLLGILVVLYVSRFQPTLAGSLVKTVNVCLLVTATVALALQLSKPPWHAVPVPLTVAALIVAIAYNPPFALLMSMSLALVMSLALGTGLEFLLVQMGGLAAAVLLLRDVRTRGRLVEVAALAGLAYVLMSGATGLLTGQTARFVAVDAGRHLLCALLAGFVLGGTLPVIEKLFGIVTDVSLLELADSSHPLLEELIRRAPGTYTHSMTVATLAEAAAESIGANPLLARVGSYFHDVGKMLKPQYFIENQSGENRHDALEPALSTLVIVGHVKDGLALAEQYRLPKPVREFIEQHHGTTLVEYFYREALRLQESLGNGNSELEPSFRYPGPKPQTRENGIVMLADAVESSSRALSDPTPGSLCKLVHDLLMKRLLDGQFEESGLTLTELHEIEESLSKSLIALYHARIKYPEEKERSIA